jgi:3-oxoacyl-[acyl-carrier-protein] synthase-3
VKILDLAKQSTGVRVRSVASYLPSRVVTNDDLVRAGAPLAADEIERLTGIRERRHAADDEASSDLATRACALALARADVAPETVDRLVVATVSPDHMSPSAACFVQRNLGLGRAPAFDVTASCAGFLYAIDVAVRSIVSGDTRVLAVASDVRSRFVDPTDRATCALFGDGAGAALLEAGEPGRGVLGVGIAADGRGVHSVYVPAGGSRMPASDETVRARAHTIRMEEGPQVYLAAIEGMAETASTLLQGLGVGMDDVTLVVPHQPNRRILDRLGRVMRVDAGRIFVNVERTGNMSAASCAVAFDEALRTERVKDGDLVLLLAGGAGYTAGAALVRVDDALIASARSDR